MYEAVQLLSVSEQLDTVFITIKLVFNKKAEHN